MRRLLKYLGKYKKESVLGPLFKLLEASFELLIPLVVARIVDVGIKNRDMGEILRLGAVMIGLGLLGLLFSVTAQYFAAKAAVGFAAALRHDLFKHIQGLSYTEMDEAGTSTLITRMTSDVNQVQSGINLVLRLFLRSPFIVFGAMAMAFTIDFKAALIFVAVIPALSVVVFGIMAASIPMYRKVQSRLDKVLRLTRENLSGVRVIRAFNKEEDEKAAFGSANEKLVRQQVLVGRISALMNPMTYVIINAATMVLIWTGAWQVENSVITQGEVMALVNYMSQILVELVKLANLIITISRSLACAKRIASVFDIESSIKDKGEASRAAADQGRGCSQQTVTRQDRGEASQAGTCRDGGGQQVRSGAGGSGQQVRSGAGGGGQQKVSDRGGVRVRPPYIEYRHVSFAYKGSPEEALTDINLRVEKGQTIGVIGGTGSGKSTLVNLLPRFYDITAGRLTIDGRDVSAYSLEELRGRIGVVPQQAVLFKGTIADNLRWGKKDATVQEMEDALAVAQALDFVQDKEKGLETKVSQGGKNLSGGQRQRLTIARALIRKPEILILDDSASALDYATDARLRGAIARLDHEMTVFIVSQRAASIWNADQIVVLDDGVIAGVGTHETLLRECEVYREIYYSQFPKEGAAQ